MSGAAYWPWWMGGLTLAAVAVLHVGVSGRLLTVSGILTRILRWSEDERDRAEELKLVHGDLDDALVAATLAEFGESGLDLAPTEAQQGIPAESSPRVRLPVAAGAVFIACLILGGMLSAILGEGTHSRVGLGADFSRLVGEGAIGAAAALVGGFLVGFGARMAGGCTSGHGLCGTARLQVGSLAATAAFFVGGIGMSLLLQALA